MDADAEERFADASSAVEPLDLTVVMVTSPFASMPSLAIIQTVLDSFALIDELEAAPVVIVMDGFKVAKDARPKKGRITESDVSRYDEYFHALTERFMSPRFTILRSTSHLGFAHAVKLGLEHCHTTFALIAQHDRFFRHPFARLRDLLTAMRRHEHIRYIGFPTSGNITHDKLLHYNYDLDLLNQPTIKYDLGHQLYLQPLVFWFDSQHLCHVKRYLQIFTPFKSLPKHLADVIGLRAIKDMFLRPGDFIEDRFGQVQRNLMTSLRRNGCDDETLLQLFRWYGSYLCFDSANAHPFAVQFDAHRTLTIPMVSHLHGRLFDMQKIEMLSQSLGADKIKSTRFQLIMQALGEDQPQQSTEFSESAIEMDCERDEQLLRTT